ncbi:MAG: symmetrical bis(5'-nucleosyl)-tetraphosphatase, partial [Gammaproteobacteria bacterium]|nr:symmetrical bis(5'-nucleosyl)-tetraphosphatase [Gammaproteobacteria bacterium]
DELIDWLRQQPLALFEQDFLMIHAGLAPTWDLQETLSCAREVENILRGEHYIDFLQNMYGNEPARWHSGLGGPERYRCIVNHLTRMRYCTADGDLCHDSKGAPGSQPAGQLPWFRVPNRASTGLNIIFGHWSTLGEVKDPGIHALDTGCVWGGKLTALRLGERPDRISVKCKPSQPVSTGV